MHAWMSEKSTALNGYAVYRRSDGTLVQVTEVGIENAPLSGWDDLIYLGEVVRYIETVRGPESDL